MNYQCPKCNSKLNESPHNEFTGFKSYRCSNADCNSLFDQKDLINKKTTGTHASGIVIADSTIDGQNCPVRPILRSKGITSTSSPNSNISVAQARSRMFRSPQVKKYEMKDVNFNKFIDNGLHGGRVYSFMEGDKGLSNLTFFIVNEIIKGNHDHIIIDPLGICHKIEKKYSIKLNSFKVDSIEDAYSEILKEEKKEKLILFLDMDKLVSEKIIKDPHRKILGLSPRLHHNYLKLLATNLNKKSSLVLFSTAIPDMHLGNTIRHPFSLVENLCYGSYYLSKSGLQASLSNRKIKRSSNSSFTFKTKI